MRWMDRVVRMTSGCVTPNPPCLAGVHMVVVDQIRKEVREAHATFPETKLKIRVLNLFQSSVLGGWKRAWKENFGMMKLFIMAALE